MTWLREADYSEIRRRVMGDGFVRIGGIFPRAQIDTVRETIINSNCRSRVDDDPPQSSTPHKFRSYWPDWQCGADIIEVFVALTNLNNRLAATELEYTWQAIQYPRGGGFFAEHVHALDPQRIGVILMASQCGEHYSRGSVRFKIKGDWKSCHLDSGDICAFRHDVPHEVTPVDKDCPLNWKYNDGRWTFILSVPGAD